MSLVSERFYQEKLKKNNINIKTKYIVDRKILERNTNNSYNDDIKNGIRCEKDYFLDNKLVHQEKIFDSRIEYSFIFNNQKEGKYQCPNCGVESEIKDFINGCPYCGTNYNIDYTDKNLGSKYHYDLVLKNPLYRIITLIVDLIISFLLAFLFIKFTSRTFNNYDVLKIVIYGLILSLLLYYIFYIADAYVVLLPIKHFKERENQKQINFWNQTKIDKKVFFNNLNYEIQKKYSKSEDIIDYDIIDYLGFKEVQDKEDLYVTVDVNIRKVYFQNKKIFSKYQKESYTLKRLKDFLELKEGANLIKCPNCGSSIDATKGKCQYCNSEIKYLQEWIMK